MAEEPNRASTAGPSAPGPEPASVSTADPAPSATVTRQAQHTEPGAESAQPEAGVRSAEARELERQLDEARQQLRAAEQRAQESLDRWQRAQADLANYRRRAQFEREELEKFAVAALVAALLPVLDNFDRAWQTLPGQLRHLTWLSGVALVHSQLRGILGQIGLAEIECLGQAFDASLHEAVEREEGDGPPHVVAVLQAGYKLHERVLRPALVKVGPPPPEERVEDRGSRVEEGSGQQDEQSGTSGDGGAQVGPPSAQNAISTDPGNSSTP